MCKGYFFIENFLLSSVLKDGIKWWRSSSREWIKLGSYSEKFLMLDYEQAERWRKENLYGVIGHEISDLDGDGQLELLVLSVVDGAEYTASVYEKERGQIILNCETIISEGRKGDSEIVHDYFDFYASDDITSYSVINTEEGTFLLYKNQIGGSYMDGRYAELFLLKYNGKRISPVMKIKQREVCSSDFEYIAYKYDADGKQISEEPIYREGAWENTGEAIYDDDGSILARQFSEYGIEINREVQMVDEDWQYLIADSVNQETVSSIEMWIESYDYSTIVGINENPNLQFTVHFNVVGK